jgi:hypothetical protein
LRLNFFSVFWSGSGAITLCLLCSTPMLAGGRNLGDYPLRVHIFQLSTHSHYRNQLLNYVDGEGRANLYENGQPRGFDYSFRCSERLMTSAGYETYAARWKKPGREIEVLMPVMGKPGSMDSCNLELQLKDGAYYRHNGVVDEEPAATFKAWMEKHQYDPGHGKNEPIASAPAPGNPQ